MSIPVLVVDDSALSRKLAIRALSSHVEIEVTQAKNGAEALELFEKGLYKLILLDLHMPKKNGFAVLQELQALESDTPVIVISSDIQNETRRRVLRLGAIGVVSKPVLAPDLTWVLKRSGVV